MGARISGVRPLFDFLMFQANTLSYTVLMNFCEPERNAIQI